MRIYIKQNNRKTIMVPAPMGLIKIALSFGNIGISIAKRYVPEEQREYFDSVDIRELKKSIDVLKGYKGLRVVDVNTSDGTSIKIII